MPLHVWNEGLLGYLVAKQASEQDEFAVETASASDMEVLVACVEARNAEKHIDAPLAAIVDLKGGLVRVFNQVITPQRTYN